MLRKMTSKYHPLPPETPAAGISNAPTPLSVLSVSRLSEELLGELVLIAQEEWNQAMTREQAAELGKWLVGAYQALLEN